MIQMRSAKAETPRVPYNERPALRFSEGVSYSGFSRSKLYEQASRGRIKIVKVDGVSLIDRASLDDLLTGRA